MIPDQGTLTETAPVKLLLSLYEQDQTGILYFRQNEVLKVFYLNRGRISWAISADEADRVDHVLLAKKLVDPNALAPYQAGNKISETFGKVLVENGVITLEVLIQATREQARLIALSVLRWSTGNYQLVQEPPPNRMMSLDLEIPAIVIQYVLGQMDVNIVWEELGLKASDELYVRDLWVHATSGPHAGGIDVSVEPDDVAFLRLSKRNEFPIPPIIVADTYLLTLRSSTGRAEVLTGALTVTNKGDAALPFWRVHPNSLPPWLEVEIRADGKSQAFLNRVATAGLKKGSYHAQVRADNVEPLSGKPMSAPYYDVDLEVARDVRRQP